jgi:hypothetical protein
MESNVVAEKQATSTTEMGGTKLSFPLIDILKFIFAIGIMTTHLVLESESFSWMTPLLSILSQLGVAFFFISSGFLSARKAEKLSTHKEQSKCYLKTALRHLILYSIWSFFYLMILIAQWITKKMDIVSNLLLFVRAFFVGGSYGQLWFLWALIICDLVLALFSLIHLNKWIVLAISILPYAVCLFLGPYSLVFGYSNNLAFADLWYFQAFSNSLGRGLLYVVLGLLLAKSNPNFHKLPAILLFSISVIAYSVEFCLLYFLWGAFPAIAFTLPFFAFEAMAMCLSFNMPGKAIYVWMRKMSILLYVLHSGLFILYNQFIKIVTIPSCKGLVPLLIVGSLTFALSALVVWLSSKPKLKFLHFLY